MKYKIMAAYAAGLIADGTNFIPAVVNNDVVVWFVKKEGDRCHHLYRYEPGCSMSILGAMRAAYDSIGADARAFNRMHNDTGMAAVSKFKKKLTELDAKEAYTVLMFVAK